MLLKCTATLRRKRLCYEISAPRHNLEEVSASCDIYESMMIRNRTILSLMLRVFCLFRTRSPGCSRKSGHRSERGSAATSTAVVHQSQPDLLRIRLRCDFFLPQPAKRMYITCHNIGHELAHSHDAICLQEACGQCTNINDVSLKSINVP